jgi:hypothetical protein
VLGVLLLEGSLDKWSFIAIVGVTFFLASAGASAAYLTVSEIFPMETRALSIAFFYSVGTALGGITGPLLFGELINSGKVSEVAIGFFIGAVVMAIGGIAELGFGVRSEQRPLEDIATPLTAEDAEEGDEGSPAGSARGADPRRSGPARARALSARYRPGPGSTARWLSGTSVPSASASVGLNREVDAIVATLRERGSTSRSDLARAVGGRYWGPGRFGAALRAAVQDGHARRVGPTAFAAVEPATTAPQRRRSDARSEPLREH